MKNDWKSKVIYGLYYSYWKIQRYFWEANFTKKHISFGLVDGKFQITTVEHEDYIANVQKKLDSIVYKKRIDFIKQVLEGALNGCNFIIFSPENDNNKFIQFWTADHKLKLNFWSNKTNGMKKYYLPIVGLLSESGFVNYEIEKYSGSMIYKVEKAKDHISVDANFRINIDLASKFADLIFKDIYKIGSHKLITKVE